MNTGTYQTTNKGELVEKIFPYLVKRGLENISIRELCKGTGIVQGSLYYWFHDKTNIVCESTLYGLEKVTNKIFEYVFASLADLRGFFGNCLGEIGKYKNELRFAYQMAASPVYGDRIRAAGKSFDIMYDKYTYKLSQCLNCDKELLKPLVDLFMSAALGYVIWDEREKTQRELDFIYAAFLEIAKNRHN